MKTRLDVGIEQDHTTGTTDEGTTTGRLPSPPAAGWVFTFALAAVVTVTVPPNCHTTFEGRRTFSVDLGPSMPTDEPAGTGALPVYGKTVTVALTRR